MSARAYDLAAVGVLWAIQSSRPGGFTITQGAFASNAYGQENGRIFYDLTGAVQLALLEHHRQPVQRHHALEQLRQRRVVQQRARLAAAHAGQHPAELAAAEDADRRAGEDRHHAPPVFAGAAGSDCASTSSPSTSNGTSRAGAIAAYASPSCSLRNRCTGSNSQSSPFSASAIRTRYEADERK